MLESTIVSNDYPVSVPDVNKLITEDDTPVDNFASAKQQRFLVSSLYSSALKQPFLAEANVGIFSTGEQPAIVPDVFLSLDVQVPENWWEKQNRAYLIWKFGKPPEVVIEIVSNKEGGELDKKLRLYQNMRVSYYIVYDPARQLGEAVLHIYELRGMRYFATAQTWLEQVELGLTLWQGKFEEREDRWLRWCDRDGNILLTGDERAQEAQQQAQEAEQKAQRLTEQLKALGVNPDTWG